MFADLIDGADVALIERGGGAGLTVKAVQRLLV